MAWIDWDAVITTLDHRTTSLVIKAVLHAAGQIKVPANELWHVGVMV